MNAPTTYAEWMPLLDEFRAGNDEVISTLSQGSIEWTSVVAERWVAQFAECLAARLRLLSAQLQRALDRGAGNSFAVESALLDARRRAGVLRTFCTLRALPENVKQTFVSQLEAWAEQTQRSLEGQAAAIRNDNGRLLKLFRDHPLTKWPPARADEAREPSVPPRHHGRGIIF